MFEEDKDKADQRAEKMRAEHRLELERQIAEKRARKRLEMQEEEAYNRMALKQVEQYQRSERFKEEMANDKVRRNKELRDKQMVIVQQLRALEDQQKRASEATQVAQLKRELEVEHKNH